MSNCAQQTSRRSQPLSEQLEATDVKSHRETTMLQADWLHEGGTGTRGMWSNWKTDPIQQSPSESGKSLSQLRNPPSLYRNLSFITVFKRAHHWSLSWGRCIQSTTSSPISLRCILKLSSHLGLGLRNSLLFRFPDQNLVWISRFTHACYMTWPSYLPRFDHSNNIWWSVKVMKLLMT
jgi:hypothetical protein